MFKVIESDEEFESARAAGLLWVNCSSLFPRPVDGWRQVGAWGRTVTEHYWRNRTNDPANYMPEDFAVLVEEDE